MRLRRRSPPPPGTMPRGRGRPPSTASSSAAPSALARGGDQIPIRSAARGGGDQEMFLEDGPIGYTKRPASLQSPGWRSVVEADQAVQAEYLVWYGTNRRPNDPSDPRKGYSATRDRVVHHGSCQVFIPKSHKIGSIGSPWWKRLLTFTSDRLRLPAINELEESVYWNGVAEHLASVRVWERSALIFVHGYNVSFASAALRAAQIGFDLSIKGAVAFFSWPSQGSARGYPADEATIEASEGVIGDFMTDFAGRSGANAVHVIAHSVGNRGVLRAVNRIAAKAQWRSGKPFGQIILAAADVDAGTFQLLSAAYAKIASRTTLYVSQRDLAVEASRWLHNFPRAGLMPPTLVLPGIDTINVTNADLTMLGHGYVAAARAVLVDMHLLITHGAPPDQRFGLQARREKPRVSAFTSANIDKIPAYRPDLFLTFSNLQADISSAAGSTSMPSTNQASQTSSTWSGGSA
jgi:esterase/lipase superfamily enzyme